jgi:hypothetical protein
MNRSFNTKCLAQSLREALGLALFAGGALTGTAQITIVNWGGDYVGTNTVLGRTGTASSEFGNVGGSEALDSRRQIPFSSSTPLNPTSSYAGESSTFYGFWSVIHYDSGRSPEVGFQRITNDGGTDTITFRAELPSEAGASEASPRYGEAHGMLVWRKADFLSLGTATVALDANSGFSVALASPLAEHTKARWVVGQGSSYYVSELTFASSHTLTNPASTRWAPYDPNTGLAFSNGTYSSMAFDDVQDVGLYFASAELRWTSPTVGGLRVDVATLSVSAIPEPADYVLIVSAAALLVAAGRKRIRTIFQRRAA